MTFGAFISTKRKEAKLNLRDTAKHLGIAYGYLCDIEQGRRPAPEGKFVERISSFLELSKEEHEMLLDLAADSRQTVPADLPDYIRKHDIVRAALRVAKEVDAMLSAFAQAESESISESVKWGIRQAMREGKVRIQYKRLYGFKRGEDGGLEIVPEQAVVVRSIYDQYLAGASYSMIKERLEAEHILNASGKQEWSLSVIRSILTNEKYYGDVLQQKTFTQDCISKKKVRNTGQLPMYLVTNNHQGIIDRQTFDAVQVEMARRGACKSPSRKNAPTGLSAYKSRYALSERLVCGECGTLYRRCTWSKRGKKKVVWRCVSRLDYGTKYCHKSPTLEEGSLQRTILAAISSVMSQKETIISRITGAMEQTLGKMNKLVAPVYKTIKQRRSDRCGVFICVRFICV